MALNLPDRLLSTTEVATVLKVHPNTVRGWSNSGVVRVACRLGTRGDRRFLPDDIRSLWEGRVDRG